MNYCSEVSHFSYKNTVLLIQLKKFNDGSPAGEIHSVPRVNMNSGPVPAIGGSQALTDYPPRALCLPDRP